MDKLRRYLLLTSVAIAGAALVPVACLGILIGFGGLIGQFHSSIPGPFSWMELAYLFLGLGGIFGFSAWFVAELAPRAFLSAKPVRATISFMLAWGSLAALFLGVLFTAATLSNRLSWESWVGPLCLGLSFLGYRSRRSVRAASHLPVERR